MKGKTTSKYEELLDAISIENIFYTNGNFQRLVSPKIASGVDKRSIKIERATFDPLYSLDKNMLGVPVGYRVSIFQDTELLAKFEYQYEVLFSVKASKVVSNALDDENTLKRFVHYQMYKFVWSYLRCAVDDACSKLGMKRITLPLQL